MNVRLENILGPILIVILVSVVFGIYAPGRFGDFLLDDYVNIRPLSQVEQGFDGFLRYVYSGAYNNLDRWLSKLSFLIDSPSWPTEPFRLKQNNILLHILNGLLIIWVFVRLMRITGHSERTGQIVSLALPSYPPSDYIEQPFTLNISGQQYPTKTIEDIEALLREDLDDESAVIHAMALARMVSKYKLNANADEQNSSVALFAAIFTMLTELADTRSWNMLPSTIQIARISLPAGEYSLPYPVNPESLSTSPAESKLAVSSGEKVVLFVPGVSKRIFSFTQSP